MKRKVAIQGIGGCNHYIAAKLFFKNDNIQTIDCDTFKELAGHVVKDPSVLGIMAIENTIAGSLLQNYKILKENKLVIVGEYKLRITHALVAMPGVEVGDIKEINTHPMAFMQCEEFLNTLPNVKLVEKEDTAGSAKWIKENNLRDHAAICPAGAAELYGMNVLADGIETNKRNFTRFLILANKDVAPEILRELCVEQEDINKSSMVFTLPHTSGSLSKVLAVLSFYDMNLSMIQSMPIVGEEWRYQFYVNLLFTDYKRYRQAIDAILPLTKDFEILGEYMEGEQSVQ
ncbi:MAG: prephenate dehydratase [Bacteroidales bacterium]|nr:prephenate dehydratase [Bacteroidales bacterium]MBQ7019200.1 prephenate dehydratase [Bacteroidales bacterium]MBR2477982.1 prephenate dehydratase [Bacteroidales bacterium]